MLSDQCPPRQSGDEEPSLRKKPKPTHISSGKLMVFVLVFFHSQCVVSVSPCFTTKGASTVQFVNSGLNCMSEVHVESRCTIVCAEPAAGVRSVSAVFP